MRSKGSSRGCQEEDWAVQYGDWRAKSNERPTRPILPSPLRRREGSPLREVGTVTQVTATSRSRDSSNVPSGDVSGRGIMTNFTITQSAIPHRMEAPDEGAIQDHILVNVQFATFWYGRDGRGYASDHCSLGVSLCNNLERLHQRILLCSIG
jgi:hypothetical protein